MIVENGRCPYLQITFRLVLVNGKDPEPHQALPHICYVCCRYTNVIFATALLSIIYLDQSMLWLMTRHVCGPCPINNYSPVLTLFIHRTSPGSY